MTSETLTLVVESSRHIANMYLFLMWTGLGTIGLGTIIGLIRR